MGLILRYKIKAILFGVDESIINKLDLGNSYKIEKDCMINHNLWEEFDYTAFGLRRIYETAKLNDNLDVAVLSKNEEIKYEEAYVKDGEGWFVDDKKVDDIIFDHENDEMEYIDRKMRIIRLYSENSFNIKELLIITEVIDSSTNKEIYHHNSKIPFPDKIIGNIDKLHLINDEEAKSIYDFVSKIDLDFKESTFSSKLLSSAIFLYDQSYTSPVATLRFMVCVIGLESLLVDGNSELSYRLSRNCAMLLSSNSEEYLDLLTKMKKIYQKRSDYVHNGMVKSLEEDEVIETRGILRSVIFKIIEKNISKESLIKELDLKGFTN